MKPLYQILEIAKQYLSGSGSGKSDFICHAIGYAETAGKITWAEEKAAVKFISNKIAPNSTLTSHLKDKGVISENIMSFHPQYWPIRDAWLDKQIANLKKNIRVQKKALKAKPEVNPFEIQEGDNEIVKILKESYKYLVGNSEGEKEAYICFSIRDFVGPTEKFSKHNLEIAEDFIQSEVKLHPANKKKRIALASVYNQIVGINTLSTGSEEYWGFRNAFLLDCIEKAKVKFAPKVWVPQPGETVKLTKKTDDPLWVKQMEEYVGGAFTVKKAGLYELSSEGWVEFKETPFIFPLDCIEKV